MTAFLTKIIDCQQGEAWVANIYIWNGPKYGYWLKNNETDEYERTNPTVNVYFESIDVIGATLYWKAKLWGELIPGQVIKAVSYPGHIWKIYKNNKVIKSFIIEADKDIQKFSISSNNIVTSKK